MCNDNSFIYFNPSQDDPYMTYPPKIWKHHMNHSTATSEHYLKHPSHSRVRWSITCIFKGWQKLPTKNSLEFLNWVIVVLETGKEHGNKYCLPPGHLWCRAGNALSLILYHFPSNIWYIIWFWCKSFSLYQFDAQSNIVSLVLLRP